MKVLFLEWFNNYMGWRETPVCIVGFLSFLYIGTRYRLDRTEYIPIYETKPIPPATDTIQAIDIFNKSMIPKKVGEAVIFHWKKISFHNGNYDQTFKWGQEYKPIGKHIFEGIKEPLIITK